jgi:signal transduction histidine kinase
MAALIRTGSTQIRAFAFVVAVAAYAGIFAYLYEIYGSGITPLSIGPVMLAAWWFGFRPALICAALVFAINTVVIAGTFTPNLADVIEVGGSGAIALILIGGVTGKMRDLSHQLRRELNERKITEEDLRQHRANLEGLVSARTRELEEAVLQLRQEIAERKQVQEELKQSLEKEQRLNQLKSRFTSMVSHEFRTPLTVIQSSAELLETYADRMPAANKTEKFRTIQTQVCRMVELLDDILALDRAESIGPVYNPQPLDLAAYCKSIVDEFQPTAKTHQIIMTATADAGSAMLDETLMRRALWNLLSNAVKYSPTGAVVEMRIARNADQALISVKDYGIGVPEEDRKDLFEIFHRANNVGSIQGTGLGLPIVKQAVLAHGGSIDFESEIGVGTTFTITLPRVTGEMNASPDAVSTTA